MYTYEEVDSVHLEVTSKCQARCPMCPRRVNGGPLLDTLTLDEITLEMFVEWFPHDFLRRLKFLNMCGNLGDPIVAKDTVEIFNFLRAINPDISLQMHTNGSGRTEKWWQELAKANVKVIFGLDGLEDTHSLYRVSTDFNRIIKNAKTFIEAGGDARWDMLVFKHNEHQIEQCEQLSKDLGFKGFSIKHTARFKDNKLDVIDDEYNVIHTIEPSSKSVENTANVIDAIKESLPQISCKAKEGSQIYVGANGNVSPCCWLDFDWVPQYAPNKIDYMTKIKVFPNLHKTTLKNIFESNFFNKIEKTWSTCGLKECSKQCGKFDKLNSQFEVLAHE